MPALIVHGGAGNIDAARLRARRAEAGTVFAEQVVGGAVIGLAAVAEASGNRTERHRCAQRHVADAVKQIEEAERDCYCPVEVALLPGAKRSPQRDAPAATLKAISGFVADVLRLNEWGQAA